MTLDEAQKLAKLLADVANEGYYPPDLPEKLNTLFKEFRWRMTGGGWSGPIEVECRIPDQPPLKTQAGRAIEDEDEDEDEA